MDGADKRFVTVDECERKRKEALSECNACHRELEAKIQREHDANLKQDGELKSISETLSSIKRVGWFIAAGIGGTLIASVLGLILK